MTENNNPRINWYPGHMAKNMRLLREQIQKNDLVLEICDARLPLSSRNPDLLKTAAGKQRIVLLNKTDLADPKITELWINEFRSRGEEPFACNLKKIKIRDLIHMVDQIARPAVEKAAKRGIHKVIRGIVIGIPNVGKSTLINRIKGSNIAQTGDRPGVTRSQQWIQINPYLELLDTPGLLWPKLDDQQAAMRLCYIGAINDDAIDLERIALSLLEDAVTLCPEKLRNRFHLEDLTLQGISLLEAACRGRGFILKGDQPDFERCERVLLDEFRSGLLGQISLEKPGAEKVNS